MIWLPAVPSASWTLALKPWAPIMSHVASQRTVAQTKPMPCGTARPERVRPYV